MASWREFAARNSDATDRSKKAVIALRFCHEAAVEALGRAGRCEHALEVRRQNRGGRGGGRGREGGRDTPFFWASLFFALTILDQWLGLCWLFFMPCPACTAGEACFKYLLWIMFLFLLLFLFVVLFFPHQCKLNILRLSTVPVQAHVSAFLVSTLSALCGVFFFFESVRALHVCRVLWYVFSFVHIFPFVLCLRVVVLFEESNKPPTHPLNHASAHLPTHLPSHPFTRPPVFFSTFRSTLVVLVHRLVAYLNRDQFAVLTGQTRCSTPRHHTLFTIRRPMNLKLVF